jgi:catechol 2,3-dioxygenase-like lactoylglutathione lyase family enzyme
MAVEVERASVDALRLTRPSPIRVRKIGHIVYEVTDVARSARFWQDVLGFTFSDMNEKGMVFLRCNADHHVIGLKPAKLIDGGPEARAGRRSGMQIEHFALEMENLDALFAARDYLRENGIPIVFEGRKGAGCNYSLHFTDPDGYEIELYSDMDQIGPDGRTRPASQFRPARSLDEAAANPVPSTW